VSLVCLGACLFTMCGQFAFRATTQEWDAARVSAAVPSGVGFLGSALIWKETQGARGTPGERHSVHGLTTGEFGPSMSAFTRVSRERNHLRTFTEPTFCTEIASKQTAASVWLSASVGIGAGGALYIYCAWAVVLVVFVLRLGPRMVLMAGDDASFDDTGSELEWETGDSGKEGANYVSEDDEPQPLTRREQRIMLQEEAAALTAAQLHEELRQSPSASTLSTATFAKPESSASLRSAALAAQSAPVAGQGPTFSPQSSSRLGRGSDLHSSRHSRGRQRRRSGASVSYRS